MLVLGIETTCDETSSAVVKDGWEIFSNIVLSQEKIHQKYGGVFPEIACRFHLDTIIQVIDESIKKAKVSKEDLDLIAVANGPGLIGALLIGLNVAKGLSLSWNIPFIGVNHIEAHIYASMMDNLHNLQFPALGIVISGGHTMLVKILDVGKYKLIGTTIDDAIGEAFDKVARMLNLPYPGGPEIEKLAEKGDPNKFNFFPSRVKKRPFDFSFSGLKTKVLYTVKGQNSNKGFLDIIKEDEKKDIAASFQKAAFEDIIEKSFLAANHFNFKAIYIGGGVSNNKKLREMFNTKNFQIPIFWPKNGLSLDNAAMIAGLGFHKRKRKEKGDSFSLEPFARTSIF